MTSQITNTYTFIAFILGNLVAPLVIKFSEYFIAKWRKKEGNDNRSITEDELSMLKMHGVFSDINYILQFHLKDLYNNSKQDLPQKLFMLQVHTTLKKHRDDCVKQLERMSRNKDKVEKKLVVRTVQESILKSKDELHTVLQELGIPIKVINIFNRWYDVHFKWYYKSIDRWLYEANGYYNEIYELLNLTRAFVSALLISVDESIDSYNGEVTCYMTNDNITIHYGELSNILK